MSNRSMVRGRHTEGGATPHSGRHAGRCAPAASARPRGRRPDAPVHPCNVTGGHAVSCDLDDYDLAMAPVFQKARLYDAAVLLDIARQEDALSAESLLLRGLARSIEAQQYRNASVRLQRSAADACTVASTPAAAAATGTPSEGMRKLLCAVALAYRARVEEARSTEATSWFFEYSHRDESRSHCVAWILIAEPQVVSQLNRLAETRAERVEYAIGSQVYETVAVRDSRNLLVAMVQTNTGSNAVKAIRAVSTREGIYEQVILGNTRLNRSAGAPCACQQTGWLNLASARPLLEHLLYESDLSAPSAKPSARLQECFIDLAAQFCSYLPHPLALDTARSVAVLKPQWLKQVFERALQSTEALHVRLVLVGSTDASYDRAMDRGNIFGVLEQKKRILSFDGVSSHKRHRATQYPKGSQMLALLLSPCRAQCEACGRHTMCNCRGSLSDLPHRRGHVRSGWNIPRRPGTSSWDRAHRVPTECQLHDPYVFAPLGLIVVHAEQAPLPVTDPP